MAKITEDELKRISLLKQDAIEIASILGELNYQKIVIDNQIDEQKQRIFRLKKDEFSFFEQLKDKYGNVTINIETGEIN